MRITGSWQRKELQFVFGGTIDDFDRTRQQRRATVELSGEMRIEVTEYDDDDEGHVATIAVLSPPASGDCVVGEE